MHKVVDGWSVGAVKIETPRNGTPMTVYVQSGLPFDAVCAATGWVW